MSQTNQTVTLVVSADPGTTAQFSVTIDGVQEGTFTTNADDSTGQSDSINITGDFGPSGPQQVDVTFLNDQFADMFVHSVDVNGHVFLGSTAQNGANPQQITDTHDPNDAPMTADGTAVFNTAGSPPINHTIAQDFNGDGVSDILAQSSDGSVSISLMQNGDVSSTVAIGPVDPHWHAVGTGDFEAGGNTDILWRNDDGSVGIWQMNGTAISGVANLGVVDSSWHTVGTGDFNGDGKADIVWENDNGTVGVWLMNGMSVSGVAGLGQLNGATSHVVGTGDFAGNGNTDLLIQNQANDVTIWQTSGTTVSSMTDLGTVDPAWHFAGIGDFDGDGRADVLWQNDNGMLGIWHMNGASIASVADVTGVTLTPDQHVVDIGQYQGNAISDILVENSSGQFTLLTLDQNEHATATTVHAPMTDLHLV